MFSVKASLCSAILAFAAPAVADDIIPAQSQSMTERISAFSGKPVPRFETLKYASVHGRTGPSLEHPIAWRYERRGLPVMVIKESRDWRMVRDPKGDEVWMHKRTLGGQPGVMVFGDQPVPFYASSRSGARMTAKIEPGAVATLVECDAESCQVFINNRKGWVAKDHLWGAPGTSPKPVDVRLAGLTDTNALPVRY